MRKFKLFFACMLMTLFSVGQMWAVDYELMLTLDVASGAPSGTTTTALTTNQSVLEYLQGAVPAEEDIVSASKDGGDVYKGKGQGGGSIPQACLKLGKASGPGSISFTIADSYDNITKVVVVGYGWKTSSSISVNSATAQSYSTAQVEHEYVFDNLEATKTISIAVTSSAVCVTEIRLYKTKAGGNPTCATPTFSPAAGLHVGTQNVTISCETTGATIYYTTNGDDPTTSSSIYEGTIPVSATTTIKALAVMANYDNSSIASATYTIVEHAGTVADPYSVADARTVIDAGVGVTGVYAKGIVSEIVTAYNSQYGNISYNISADGLTTSDQLQAYRGFDKDGDWFTSADDVQIGDEVVVYGNLKKYQSTYEFDQNNQRYSFKRKAALSWNGVTANSFAAELNGQNTFPTLVNTNNVSPITYSSDNTDVVEVISNEGVPTLKATGTTLITASFAGNENYLANSVSYTLNVSETISTGDITYECNGANSGCPESGLTDQTNLPENLPAVAKDGFNFGGWYKTSTFEETSKVEGGEVITEDVTLYAKWEEPYTVAQARAAIDAGVGVTGVYAKGIVSEIVTAYNSQYGNISYNISADGLTTSDQLQAYRGFDKDGDWFTSADDVQVGDEVVVYGNLKKYQSTYEFDQNNQRYSFSRPAPKYTVRFWNSEGWDEVYAYVWKYDEVNDVTTEPVAWPGLATSVVDGWNEFEVEEGYNIIFNNNKSGDDAKQTIDIKNITADVCYVLTGETVNTSLAVAADNDCNDRFYIAGDEALTGDNWNTTADRLVNGSITFTNIAANTYKFKITNGTWNWNIGGAKVDATACDGVTIEDTDGDGNVVFTIDEAKDITITYNKATDKIVVTAVKYVEPVYKAIVASYGDKYYAMTTTLDGDGFTPLEVAVDADGNVIVNSDGEKNSILWKYTAGAETATFQDANNLYLAKGSGNTGLALANTAVEWTLHEDGYYYVTSGRTFLYQGDGNIFKNYSLNNSTGYSDAPTFYAADKIVIRATAKFFAPASWENVYAYTYSWDEINGTTEYNGAWPGEQLTKDGDWYAISMPIGAKVIFHNNLGGNSNQTVDIPVPASSCFAWNGLENNDNPKMTVATISTCEMNYSIAGNEALTGVAEWGHTALVNNTITYNEVAVGTYKFKISNGTWDWSLGGAYVDQTACSGVTIEDTDGDGNAVFSIAIKSNITITYNPATEKISIVAVASTPEILVDKAEIAFGTVDYEDAVDAEIINVTLISVANATISLSGDADAFQLDKNALTASGIVSVTPVTTTSGTFNATLTISDASTAAEAKEITLSLTVNEAPVEDDVTGTWTLVTDAATLAAGKKVIIAKYVDADETVTLGMTQNTNNRAQVEGASVTGNVLTPAQGTAVFTLVACTEENTWAFKSSANEYLYAASSTKNWLRSQAENDANGSWVISIENGAASVVAQGTNTRNTMRYNNGDHIFSCYGSGQQDIALYMLEEEEPEPQYETIRSGLTPGRYYTVCYDKTMKKIKGASLWSFNGKDANMAYIVEENLASYPAGTPYLIYAESDKLEAITEAVDTPEAGSNNGLYGTLIQMSNTDLLAAGATHLLINNELRPLGNGYLKENRAYVILGEIPNTTPTSSNAPGKRVRAIPMHQDAATGIDELNASEKPVKMVIDGQLYILRGEKMYDATGRLVK